MTHPAVKEEPKFALYHLTQDIIELDNALEAEGGDVTEGTHGAFIMQWLEKNRDIFQKKVDEITRYVRSLVGYQTAIAAEIKELALRSAQADRKIESVKTLVRLAMLHLRVDKVAGDLHTAKIVNNGGKAPMILSTSDPEKFPMRFIKIKKEIDMDALRKALEENDIMAKSVASLQDRGTHVRLV